MKVPITYKGFILALALVVVSGTGLAFGATIEGHVQGLQCVLGGKLCPVDNQDPHIAAERNFVVLTAKDGYYLVPNLDRAILARHLSKKVRINGMISDKYKAITADRVDVYKNGRWIKTWSRADELEALKELHTGG